MGWIVKIKETAFKELKKIAKDDQIRILDYINTRILETQNPRQLGTPLRSIKSRLWRYRIGKYRIICAIQDKEMIVLVIGVGKRDIVYTNVG